jgi:excinuclease ABC subunit B
MGLAIDETNRRRKVQIAFNEANGITPKGIVKGVKDMIDGVYDVEEGKRERKAAQEQANYESLSEKQIAKEMKRLEKAMHDAAKNLEFEKAADFRDQLKTLKVKFYGASMPDLIE